MLKALMLFMRYELNTVESKFGYSVVLIKVTLLFFFMLLSKRKSKYQRGKLELAIKLKKKCFLERKR